ncbi:MAG: SprB repeat-containing protein [Cyclobacteriaceae bacterium]
MSHVTRVKRLALVMLSCLFLTNIACKEDELVPPPDCTTLNLILNSKSDASSCTAMDGNISIGATGGVAPYVYESDFLASSDGNFAGLRGGQYAFTVTDSNGCIAKLDVGIGTVGSTFGISIVAEASTVCSPDSNGFIEVNVTGGVGPYEFKRDNGSFVPVNTFLDLGPGDYIVEARDAAGCSIVVKTEVPGMRYGTIKSIIELNCIKSGCHNGDIGADNNYTIFDNVKEYSTSIRARTSDLTMPPGNPLSQEQIELIACWVDEGANN